MYTTWQKTATEAATIDFRDGETHVSEAPLNEECHGPSPSAHVQTPHNYTTGDIQAGIVCFLTQWGL